MSRLTGRVTKLADRIERVRAAEDDAAERSARACGRDDPRPLSEIADEFRAVRRRTRLRLRARGWPEPAIEAVLRAWEGYPVDLQGIPASLGLTPAQTLAEIGRAMGVEPELIAEEAAKLDDGEGG